MKHIKVVLGSNLGDEGKGLMTHYFSKNAEGKVLNILFNGGVQRGHTVNDHVFHCFGSGTFDGADTYYHKDFMVNPIGWDIEYDQLLSLGFNPSLYIDPECRVTLPYDMIINRKIEEKRGSNRHGSCGMGIYETRLRSEQHPILAKDLMDQYTLYNKLKTIENVWVPKRCKELGVDLINCDDMINSFLVLSNTMMKYVSLKSFDEIKDNFDTIIYEGGQWRLLSEDNIDFAPHLTPSFTGSQIISKEINEMSNVDVEVCYVTRPYMTRHGAGMFPTECKKEDINKDIVDKTNQPNPYQETLRFGYLDVVELIDRTNADFDNYKVKAIKSLAVTQVNYTHRNFVCGKDIKVPVKNVLFEYDKGYTFDSQEI